MLSRQTFLINAARHLYKYYSVLAGFIQASQPTLALNNNMWSNPVSMQLNPFLFYFLRGLIPSAVREYLVEKLLRDSLVFALVQNRSKVFRLNFV